MFICKTTLQNPYSATLSKLILFLINYNRVESHPVGIESGVNNKLFQIYIFFIRKSEFTVCVEEGLMGTDSEPNCDCAMM